MARNPPAIPIVIGRFAGHVARKPPDYYSNNRGGAGHMARKPPYYYSNNRPRPLRQAALLGGTCYYYSNGGLRAMWPAPPVITIVIGRLAGHMARKPPYYYSNNRGFACQPPYYYSNNRSRLTVPLGVMGGTCYYYSNRGCAGNVASPPVITIVIGPPYYYSNNRSRPLGSRP